jgi:hypothetical protein
MDRISKVPLERLDPEIKAMMRASDEALGGSEWNIISASFECGQFMPRRGSRD